jgi:hypothetical protein
MPWHLIAKAFGWRAAADEDGAAPILVGWHPRLRRHFSGRSVEARRAAVHPRTPTGSRPLWRKGEAAMKTYLMAFHFLVEADDCPNAEIADALHGILTDDDAPDDSAFPLWPGRMF